MWKEEKPIVPYNYTSHVKIDNLSFVAGLRQTVSVDTQIQKFRELQHINQQAAAENKLTKPTNCIFASCMYVGQEIAETLNERACIIERIKQAAVELQEQQEYFDIINEESEKAAHALLIINSKAEELEDKENIDLKRKLTAVTLTRRELEAQINAANRQLKKLQTRRHVQDDTVSARPVSPLHSPRDPNKLYFDHVEKSKHGKKHNGIYSMTAEGRAWSCCFDPDEHCSGCIDDHSVGLIHTLGNMKRNTHNYIDYPLHPLVTQSSIVLTGGNQMINKFYAESHSPKSSHKRPQTAGHLGNHHSVASHYHSSVILQNEQKHLHSGHHNHHVRHHSASRSRDKHHHRPHKHIHKYMAPDTSLAAYTLQHNALSVPLPAVVAANTTQTHAPQWHATGNVVHDEAKDAKAFNESMFSAALDKGLSVTNGNSHVMTANTYAQSMVTNGTLFHPKSFHPKSTSLVGKVRMDPTRSVVKSNRPMSSPAGYALYLK